MASAGLQLPPGPKFVLRHVHYLFGPPALTFATLRALRRVGGLPVPFWLTCILTLLSFPLFFIGNTIWRDLSKKRRAAALGAQLPPIAEQVKDDLRDGDKRFPRHVLFKLCEKYGYHFTLVRYSQERFFTFEPEHIKAMLATDFAGFEKGPGFREQMNSILGVGVFNADNELWKFHRSMTRPFFSKDKIAHFDIFDRHAADALSQMKGRLRQGYAVDWQDLVSRFTLDSATEFLFGKDVRSLAAGLPYPPTSDIAKRQRTSDSDEFASAFQTAQLAVARRGKLQEAWPLAEFWQDKAAAHNSAIDKFINPIIKDALQRKAEKGSLDEKDTEEETLLSYLLKSTDDYKMIRDETLNILLAGRDTTACTLTFAVYRLAEHPDVLRRLREEILSVVGPSRRPDYDDIRKMKYLRAVINETLRLYPPVPANVRCATKDTVLPAVTPEGKGVFIPAGTRTAYSVFVMHRRKDLWGPDALKYDPDRFLDERVHKYLTPNPFIFLPFNAGPRICLGQQFAYNEASFMLIRLLQQFSAIEFTPEVAPASMVPPGYGDSPGSDGTDRVWMGSHLTAFAKGGLWVRMTEGTEQ